ncbi:MAG TPA: 50S ribosomal protein L9 [Ignavibacteria bacterium]|nr:50S ribosomal protein L9 [Bacteroidota bacterium]HRI85006.1 50S ribosomal protein L9 [Ignavibacteria bacterium]HRK00563.1 50S ribosomal protein L9 [Ignavibacteria bacterium]
MKVILKKDNELLGDEGQIVEVKNGYARNFLIPNGIAVAASKSNLINHEEIKRQRSRKTDKLLNDANQLAGVLSSYTFDFKVKTGEENKLFGSVTSQMIHELLENKGFTTIERKKILLKEPIKSLGEHEVDIKLQQSVIAKIKVNVSKESDDTEIKSETSITEPENTEDLTEKAN